MWKSKLDERERKRLIEVGKKIHFTDEKNNPNKDDEEALLMGMLWEQSVPSKR